MGPVEPCHHARRVSPSPSSRASQQSRGSPPAAQRSPGSKDLRPQALVPTPPLPIAERRDRVGALQRALSIPASVMLMGPFWRAVTYHVFRMPRLPAYALSVGGSFPHSLFWDRPCAGRPLGGGDSPTSGADHLNDDLARSHLRPQVLPTTHMSACCERRAELGPRFAGDPVMVAIVARPALSRVPAVFLEDASCSRMSGDRTTSLWPLPR